jgi:hypothetical protein
MLRLTYFKRPFEWKKQKLVKTVNPESTRQGMVGLGFAK